MPAGASIAKKSKNVFITYFIQNCPMQWVSVKPSKATDPLGCVG